ncbi:MAG TPA: DUF5590 domain-containing protein [Candidatus Avamphibacillus intestinigallinarum]|nr:DUF5590 domain-containing protein [Candidatus Avamphibacillus intestinigallinarum]
MNHHILKDTPRWVKWTIAIVLILFIISAIYLTWVYNEAMAIKETDFDKTKNRVMKQTDIHTIDHIENATAEKQMHTVFGKTNKGKEKMAFVSLKDKKIKVIDATSIIKREEIQSIVQNDCSSCKVIKITPVLLESKPVWEATYKKSNQSYVFEYFDIYDASIKERFQLKQNFE